MAKVNKAAIRREIAQKLADGFIASGVEYSCDADIYGTMRKESLAHAKELLNKGICLSKSNYPFAWVGNMSDMFLSDAAKIVYNRKYGKK